MFSKKIKISLFISIFFFSSYFYLSLKSGNSFSQEIQLKEMIARMIIIGFDNDNLKPSDPFVREIQRYCPGGVILFDRDFYNRNQIKNIRSPSQLKELTTKLRLFASHPILIAVDQEGGKVVRLKPQYGFLKIPSAQSIGKMNEPIKAKKIYMALAKELQRVGINCDLAPVVDLAINPNNYVIVGLKRSYGKSPEKVITYAHIFCEALHSYGIINVLKHFPGHGSSTGDSHNGFVDVSNTWEPIELEPYKELIKRNMVDMIMTAHVYNKKLDSKYPATLSKTINSHLLRKKLNFNGVILSDDLQMKAISSHYSLEETVRLAINAGVDMLLFGNQLSKISLTKVVNTIYKEVKEGNIPKSRIIEANKRIHALFSKYSLSEN
ncbi:glycoside hydrolase family 3 N-terminal domain-containing protein [Desulfothermus sp.]